LKKIILASQSPRRQALMHQMGVPFEVKVSNIREEMDMTLPIQQRIEKLALDKAKAVEKQVSDPCIIIGADTIVAYKEHVLGKPKDSQDAYQMLWMLQGQWHKVYTGVALLERNERGETSYFCFTESATVYMKSLTEEEIWHYIDSKEPDDKAGAYGIQGKGSVFIEKIEGDYYTIVGLPIASLYDILKTKINFEEYWK